MRKLFVGIDAGTVVFVPTAKTFTFSGISGFDPRRVMMITNLTRGKLVYLPQETTLGGTWDGLVSDGGVLTVTLDVTAHSAGDRLQVIYGDATDSTTLIGVAGDSPPALATNASGVVGWLRKVVDVLLGTLKVQPPIPASVVVGQTKVATTGTAVQLGVGALVNGVVITARSTNAGKIFVGGAAVTTTDDGSGNGYPLAAGQSISVACANLSNLSINGTAGDYVYYAGN
ncbi:MAG: hypothetical protein QM647_15020 [Asticcacaulis sp.]|uniref:hypothetical protein n=1 Tax=Asticcacaulis sp. TaxID=1872648 RepID=UPI0039E50F9C